MILRYSLKYLCRYNTATGLHYEVVLDLHRCETTEKYQRPKMGAES